jgi:hypothetical protein
MEPTLGIIRGTLGRQTRMDVLDSFIVMTPCVDMTMSAKTKMLQKQLNTLLLNLSRLLVLAVVPSRYLLR